jgi:hypothetical protein
MPTKNNTSFSQTFSLMKPNKNSVMGIQFDELQQVFKSRSPQFIPQQAKQ